MNSINLLITLFVVSFVDSIKRNKTIACVYNVDKGPPSVIDATLCTHLLVNGFFTMGSTPHHLVFQNYERNKKILDRLKGLKSQNPNLKIVGALDCFGIDCYFDRVVVNTKKITDFVNNAIKVMREHKFNGLHLSWRYPVCVRGGCSTTRDEEKKGFSDLLLELREGLSNKETLSATVYFGYVANQAYDFNTMKRLDFLTLWTFDRWGPWSEHTQHHALIGGIKEALEFWTKKTVDKNKLLVGIPFYGVEVKLKDENNHGFGSPIDESDFPYDKWPVPEIFYQSKHIIPYNQFCQQIKSGWNLGKELPDTNPYAYKGKRWISFESPTSAANKAKLVRNGGYGGVMVWEITQDDIDAECLSSSTDRPILRAIAKELFK